MFNLTVKGLMAHKLRFLMTGLAIILGVSFMSGTMILTDTMGQSFDNLLAESNQGIDAIVQRPSTIENAGTDIRERLDASALDTVLTVDGVDAAFGSIQGFAQLVRADGDVAANRFGMTIGTNWIDHPRLNPFRLDSGHAPTGPDQAVVDRATVDNEGWTIGDTFTVLGKSGPAELTLVGAASFGDVDGIPGSTMIATDLATAQELFGEAGRFNTIVVAKDPAITADEIALRLQTVLADNDIEVVTGAADTAKQQADLRKNLKFFNTFLMAFAYISLFVGMFIIYNTFSIVVAQRTRDLAMLRTIGAGRGQVLRSVMVEAVAVALIAVAVGLALGVGMSFGLRGLLSQVGLNVPTGATVISSTTIVTAVIVGLFVTLASALAPALRASRVAPIAALRDIEIDRSHLSVKRVVIGLTVLGAGLAATAAGIKGDGSSGFAMLGAGSIITVFGVFVLGPVLARPFLRILGAPARLLSGSTGHLATENARRNPKRTSATAAALMIGVALVGYITIIAASSTAAVNDQVDKSFRADYVVDSGQWNDGGLSPELTAELAALPEVATSSPLRVAPIAIDGDSTHIAGIDTSVFDDLYDIQSFAGTLAAVTTGTVAVEADEAAKRKLDLGETVTVTFARTGAVALTVTMIFDEEIVGAGSTRWITNLDTYQANVTDQYDRQIFLKAVEGIDAATSRTAIEGVLADWPNGELQDQAGFKETITSEINSMVNLIYGLLALAVIIALIGIANTLALSVHERTREIGLLRAVGMARRQVRTLIRWESVMIAVLGTGLGLTLAIAGAWAIVQALSDEGITNIVIPAGRMTTIVGVAIIAGVTAALGPARRAGRLNILKAVANT